MTQPETFSAPMPTPRFRSRSRSQISPLTDDDRTSHGADSLAFDDGSKYIVDMKDNNGFDPMILTNFRYNLIFYYIGRYAVVRKDPPPRPPAPVRKRGSNRSGDRQQFATMPHLRKERDTIDTAIELDLPERPIRNYSTIGPTRPPRRTSIISLEDADM